MPILLKSSSFPQRKSVYIYTHINETKKYLNHKRKEQKKSPFFSVRRLTV